MSKKWFKIYRTRGPSPDVIGADLALIEDNGCLIILDKDGYVFYAVPAGEWCEIVRITGEEKEVKQQWNKADSKNGPGMP